MDLMSKLKNDIKKAGSNKSKILYFKDGVKLRVRFLVDMEDGMEVVFHDSFERGINVPDQTLFGREDEYAEDDSLRHRSQYIWPVWDYESKEVKLLMFPVNNCSPIPALMSMYENYGTLTDRDYVIQQTGKQQNKTFSVVPMDKNKFRNTKAKPFSESKILYILDKAFPVEDDDDEEAKPKTKAKKGKKPAKPDYDDEFDDDFDDENEDGLDYEEMSAKELYALCKEREIEAKPRKSEKYYINLLEEYDEAEDDWGDDDDDDEWEEE